jgi:hypothetical protein
MIVDRDLRHDGKVSIGSRPKQDCWGMIRSTAISEQVYNIDFHPKHTLIISSMTLEVQPSFGSEQPPNLRMLLN